MSPVLDATDIQDENELAQEEQEQVQQDEPTDGLRIADTTPVAIGHIQTITLAMPPEAGTYVALRVQAVTTEPNSRWLSGFCIARDYETSPHEQAFEGFEEESDGQLTEFPRMQDAVMASAADAVWWMERNSDDGDEHAQQVIEALDQWRADHEEAETFEFDPTCDCETALPAVDSCECCNQPPASIEVTVSSVPKIQTTDEAQAHFEAEKHRIECYIGKLAIEQARLKAAVKANREAMATYTEDLENHIDRGPERLPLFDRKPEAAAEQAATDTPLFDQAEPSAAEPAAAPAPETVAAEEPWRLVKLADLDGLTPKILEILEGHSLRTLGDWTDAPTAKGCDYTQLKGITEARLGKIQAAMDAYWAEHPAK